jgi:hypothetical protein
MNDEIVGQEFVGQAIALVLAAMGADGRWDEYTEDEHLRCSRIHAQLLNLGDDHLALMIAHGLSALAYREARAAAPAPNGKPH